MRQSSSFSLRGINKSPSLDASSSSWSPNIDTTMANPNNEPSPTILSRANTNLRRSFSTSNVKSKKSIRFKDDASPPPSEDDKNVNDDITSSPSPTLNPHRNDDNNNNNNNTSIESNENNSVITSTSTVTSSVIATAAAVPKPSHLLSTFKQNTLAAYKDAMGHSDAADRSRFQNWSVDALKQVLVEHNVQVRGAKHATHETLVKICDDVFGAAAAAADGEEDDYGGTSSSSSFNDVRMPKTFSFEEIVSMNDAAFKIQKAYIRAKVRCLAVRGGGGWNNDGGGQEFFRDDDMFYYNDTCDDDDDDDDYGYDEERGSYGHDTNQSSAAGRDTENYSPQKPRYFSVIQKINAGGGDANNDNLDDEISIGWRKPSWKYAKKYEASVRPHRAGKSMQKYDWRKVTLGRHCVAGGCGEQFDLWNEGKTSEFGQFGSGVTNYFKFLKWCSWIMLILSIINLPMTILNTLGTTVQYDYPSLALTTIGNLGPAKSVTKISIPGCNEAAYQQTTCTIPKTLLALYYSGLDALGTVVVIVAWLWLKTFENSEAAHLNRSTVTASDYTLHVTRGMPPSATEKELAAHFAALTGEAIAHVHMAYENAKEIEQYFARGKIMKEWFDTVQRVRYQKTLEARYGAGGFDLVELNKLLKKRDALTDKIREVDYERRRRRSKRATVPIQVFVTFESERGFVKAVSAYQMSWTRRFFGACFYPKRLRFKGRALTVGPAPEPSTIIWENLEFSSRKRFFRKCLTNAVGLLAILLSVTFTFLARDFQSKALESSSAPCPRGFDALSPRRQYDIIVNDSSLSHCYCSVLPAMQQGREEVCFDYVQSKFRGSAMSYGAGFMVVFMNSFLTWLMDTAGKFERHQSLDAMEESIMTRVFFLKFINTGCLVLLYNQKWLQNLVNVRFESDDADFGVKWYETGGISMIIVMVMSVISPHVSPMLKYFKFKANVRKIERHLTENKETDENYKIWYTQEDLNKQYLGPHFRLTYRYTQILVNFYICWMYATGMPIMPLIGAASFYMSYWVDKFLFCNFYRIPPRYADNMGKTSTNLVGFAVLVHLVMSLWILGNGRIFESASFVEGTKGVATVPPSSSSHNDDTSFASNISQRHLLPLEITLLLFITFNVVTRMLRRSGTQVLKILKCLTCRRENVRKKMMSMLNTVQIDYSRAVDRGVIKGLASFNILQNPKYQEAFAISAEFAEEHCHLNSIRGMDTQGGSLSTVAVGDEAAAGGDGEMSLDRDVVGDDDNDNQLHATL